MSSTSHLVFLVPGHKSGLRRELRQMVEDLSVRTDIPDWTCVVDTGWTRKAHAKSRARVQRECDLTSPDFPQDPRIHLLWRDDVSRQGLPKVLPEPLSRDGVLVSYRG